MRLPSTTEILAANSMYDDMPDFDPQRMQDIFDRGVLVGKICNHLALGKEPPKQFPEYDGYIDGYRLFLREHDWRMASFEDHLICTQYGFVSHPDQIGFFDDGKHSLIEIKTGGYVERAYRLQTAGQAVAASKIGVLYRYCLSLPGDGTYKLIPHTDPRDKSDFITMVQYSHLAMRLGLPVGLRLKQIMEERDAKRRNS